MNDVQRRAVASLRREGYVVVTFPPIDVKGMKIDDFEDKLFKYGNKLIDQQGRKK